MQPSIDFHALSPEIILSVTLLAVVVADSFLSQDKKKLVMPLSLAGVLAALVAAVTLAGQTHSVFGGSFVVDRFSVLFDVFFLVVAMAVLLISYRYFIDGPYHQGEYYFLLLSSFLGCVLVASSRDLLLLFLAIELVSAPAFLIAAFRKSDPRSNEAGLKFFLIGVLSSAVMLYGMSMVYGLAHTTRLSGIARAFAGPVGHQPLTLAAILFVTTGFAFKVSSVPFHFWAPDTYEGSPVPVAAFLSVASKAAGFAALLQVMFLAFIHQAHFWAPVFAILAVATMTLGNLVAMQQKQIVRLLAYSSIAQAGYMLLPFALIGADAAMNSKAFSASVLYILIYGVMNLGAFAVVTVISRGAPGMLVSDFAGLMRSSPILGIAMTVFLVSLAGIPPLAGFWAKFFVFNAAVARGGIGICLAGIMVLNSVMGLYYYLAVVRQMAFVDGEERSIAVPILARVVIVATASAVFVVGALPDIFAKFPQISTLVGH